MSKADTLRASASFGQAKGGISARRAAIEAASVAPTDGAPPPLKLAVDVISLNPDNPREELGDLTDLGASLRDHGQKTAISIMSRFAYLEGNPERKNDLEEGTKYVVIDGNTRLAAAREAGLTEIKVMLDDDLGSNPDEILESAFVANVHRQDLDPLDEAKVLQRLLGIHKTQDALAARLHRSQGWISQRLALLSLTPELKEKLQSGEEPAALLRRVGKKKPEEQEAHLRQLKEKTRKAPPETRSWMPPSIPAPAPPAAMKPATPASSGGQDASTNHDATEKTNASPAPRFNAGSPTPAQPQQQGEALMDAAFDRLDDEQRSIFIRRYFQRSAGVEAVTADMRGDLSPQARTSLADILQQVTDGLREGT
ncbi:ParB/RepB/Spo0J family partition protein (plasmid) [Streptomyces californicus]|uniref:ParB/RepB/Spo0J family partition protein n=1 Tax=Streptomyces californicus TaxID=67351 RepID=A0ABX7JCC9_9ACTN|nr:MULTISPECIES: ParB/RepB/Spo0J family partition protein [Streptomyces]QRV32443.1 ParB/RepB/Spo0J family partition protein [Streptomyces californicus]QRV45859.1 ParB/RepB/Spo0J family partition protein [Streptomyces californicus]